MSQKTIGVGIIGTGFMGKAHAYGVRNLPLYYQDLPFRARLAAVASRDAGNAERFASDLDIPFHTSDFRELLACDDVDAVCVASPNDLHEEMALAAFEAGKHVYLDKPLAHNLISAERIADAWKNSGVTAQMVFNMRFFPCVMRAKEMISAGRLGRMLSFRCAYLHSGSVGAPRTSWKQRADMGGVLYDLGAHAVDMLLWLAGPVARLSCACQTAYAARIGLDGARINAGDDASYMLVELASGAHGMIEVSKIATGAMDEFRFELSGECGAVRFELMDPNWLWFYDHTKAAGDTGGNRGWQRLECVGHFPGPGGLFVPYKNAVGWIRSHAHCMYSFLDAIAAGNPACPNIMDGLAVARLLDAAKRSANAGSTMIQV